MGTIFQTLSLSFLKHCSIRPHILNYLHDYSIYKNWDIQIIMKQYNPFCLLCFHALYLLLVKKILQSLNAPLIILQAS